MNLGKLNRGLSMTKGWAIRLEQKEAKLGGDWGLRKPVLETAYGRKWNDLSTCSLVPLGVPLPSASSCRTSKSMNAMC